MAFRKSGKLGGLAKKRGISEEQVCVLVSLDRTGDVVSQNEGHGRITVKEFDAVFGTYLDPGSLPYMDSAKNYVAFTRTKDFQHEVIKVH